MAGGVLGSGTASSGSGSPGTITVTVYTCPLTASYAVLHIFYSLRCNDASSSVRVSGQTLAAVSSTVSATDDGTASVVLGPGQSITAVATSSGAIGKSASATAWVTGYEVT
jgi:hypothetical protein